MNIRCLKKARRMKFTQWLLLYSKQILCMMSNVTELKKGFSNRERNERIFQRHGIVSSILQKKTLNSSSQLSFLTRLGNDASAGQAGWLWNVRWDGWWLNSSLLLALLLAEIFWCWLPADAETSDLGGGVGGSGGGGGELWTGTSVGLCIGTIRRHDGLAIGLIGMRLNVAVIGVGLSPLYRPLTTVLLILGNCCCCGCTTVNGLGCVFFLLLFLWPSGMR